MKEDYLLFHLEQMFDKVFKIFIQFIIYYLFAWWKSVQGIPKILIIKWHLWDGGHVMVTAIPQEKHDKVKLDGTSITRLSELDYSLSSNEDDQSSMKYPK